MKHRQGQRWQRSVFLLQSLAMTKDSPLAFRIQSDLKKRLLKIAKVEARSLSQVCELFLRLGVEEYEKEGHKHLQKMLSRDSDNS